MRVKRKEKRPHRYFKGNYQLTPDAPVSVLAKLFLHNLVLFSLKLINASNDRLQSKTFP